MDLRNPPLPRLWRDFQLAKERVTKGGEICQRMMLRPPSIDPMDPNSARHPQRKLLEIGFAADGGLPTADGINPS